MHVVETEWGFGYTLDKETYDYEIKEENMIGNTEFKVIEIDDDGVLLEYPRRYYEPTYESLNAAYKTEIVQQKLSWNVNYAYNEDKDPFLAVDGGTKYYVRLEKKD